MKVKKKYLGISHFLLDLTESLNFLSILSINVFVSLPGKKSLKTLLTTQKF